MTDRITTNKLNNNIKNMKTQNIGSILTLSHRSGANMEQMSVSMQL